MKKMLGTTVALAVMAIFISSAQAINITLAEVQNGLAVVEGNKAAKSATITWEGDNVTQTNNGGKFSFSGIGPGDCVGTLSDGTAPIEVVLLNCTPVSAASAPVPRTGQTTTYAAGDDGSFQKGVELPTPRFTDNGNGTITDNLTGLIWLKNANCPNTSRDWQTALNDMASLNASGKMNGNDCGDTSGEQGSHRTDWRLPNIRELNSLVDFAFANPAISNAAGTGQGSSGDPFSHFFSSFYWSSTTNAFGQGALAWYVGFDVGDALSAGKTVNSFFVIAVRGGS